MADSEGNYGGNGSVNWDLHVRQSRLGSVKNKARPLSDTNDSDPELQLEGIEDIVGIQLEEAEGETQDPPTAWSASGRAYFTVSIELPPTGHADRDAFIKELVDAASSGTGGAERVVFHLPIRRFRRKQITIRWKSAE